MNKLTILGIMFIVIIAEALIHEYYWLFHEEEWKDHVRITNTLLVVYFATAYFAHIIGL